jgi:5'(3')-deoxyribonucleotidase
MNKPRIFLDMDDVLNGLTMDILYSVFHCVPDTSLEHFPAHVGYDIIQAAAVLRDEKPMDFFDFWEQVPVGIWLHSPKSLECDWLIETAAELVGREEVYIATATGRGVNPLKVAAKVSWLRANTPEWLHEQYFITTHKWLLGRPGDILIDDNAANCAKFEDMGGDAILVPRPWNTLHRWCGQTDAHDYVAHRLTDMFGVEVL